MKTKTVLTRIAELVNAIQNCVLSGNTVWRDKHEDALEALTREFLPHGSGIDGKHMTVDIDASGPNRLSIGPVDFHHMDENGFYSGWTEHTAFITPAFDGFNLRITGRDRNNIKEYLAETMHEALSEICARMCSNCHVWVYRAHPHVQFGQCERCGHKDEPQDAKPATVEPTTPDTRADRLASLLRSVIAERLSILTEDEDTRDETLTSDIDDQIAHWRAIERELIALERNPEKS